MLKDWLKCRNFAVFCYLIHSSSPGLHTATPTGRGIHSAPMRRHHRSEAWRCLHGEGSVRPCTALPRQGWHYCYSQVRILPANYVNEELVKCYRILHWFWRHGWRSGWLLRLRVGGSISAWNKYLFGPQVVPGLAVCVYDFSIKRIHDTGIIPRVVQS